jgi:anaerobic selenocysteine-containing dehydrogenase
MAVSAGPADPSRRAAPRRRPLPADRLGRCVVFVNPADIEAFGLSDGDRVDLVSEFTNGDGELQERRAKDFMVVAYSTPRGNAAAYYPETNPLVALDHVAKKSNTPVSKAIVIRLEPAWGG